MGRNIAVQVPVRQGVYQAGPGNGPSVAALRFVAGVVVGPVLRERQPPQTW